MTRTARYTPREEYVNLMSEKALQEAIRQVCVARKRLYYHTHQSQHSPEGFPDTVIIDLEARRLIVSESKRAGKDPTPAQQRWLDGFARVLTIETYIWRPADLDTAIHIITGSAPCTLR